MKHKLRRTFSIALAVVMLLSLPLSTAQAGTPDLTWQSEWGDYLALTTGVPNHMQRVLLTEYIPAGLHPVTISPTLAGITNATLDVVVPDGQTSGLGTLRVYSDGTTPAGMHFVTFSAAGVSTLNSIEVLSLPTIVQNGGQTGVLNQGVPGRARFDITTSNIALGTPVGEFIFVASPSIPGIALGSRSIPGTGTGHFYINTTTRTPDGRSYIPTPAGSHNLTLVMEGSRGKVTLDFVLEVGPQTSASVRPLTVTGGTGDGYFAAGQFVSISANMPPAGQRFSHWTASSPAITFSNASAVNTTFAMPANVVTVTANFVPIANGDGGDGGGAQAPEPPTSNFPFTDVGAGRWYRSYVETVRELGLMQGVSANRFAPGQNLSRAMVATILWRMAGEPAADAGTFVDVRPGQWYSTPIAWAHQNGIVFGHGGSFNPQGNITREQFAAMMYRYAVYTGQDVDVSSGFGLDGFNDYGQVSNWAETYKRWANYNDLIRGANGRLNPRGNTIRAESAAILVRFLG